MDIVYITTEVLSVRRGVGKRFVWDVKEIQKDGKAKWDLEVRTWDTQPKGLLYTPHNL